MAIHKVLILGHSFIRRLGQFVDKRPQLNYHFMLEESATFKWHGVGVGGRIGTIALQIAVLKDRNILYIKLSYFLENLCEKFYLTTEY